MLSDQNRESSIIPSTQIGFIASTMWDSSGPEIVFMCVNNIFCFITDNGWIDQRYIKGQS